MRLLGTTYINAQIMLHTDLQFTNIHQELFPQLDAFGGGF